MVKNLPPHAGNVRDADSVPGSGRYLGETNNKPLQHSYLENPMDSGAWQATVHKVTKCQISLKQLSTCTCQS